MQLLRGFRKKAPLPSCYMRTVTARRTLSAIAMTGAGHPGDQTMNLLDSTILAVLVLGGLRGLLRGLLKELAAVAAFLLGGWIAFKYHPQAAELLAGLLPSPAARILAFTALLILVGLSAHLLGNLLTSLINLALLGWVNRLAGLALGCFEGALVIGMIFYAIGAVPFSFPLQQSIQNHAFALRLAQLGGAAIDGAKALRPITP